MSIAEALKLAENLLASVKLGHTEQCGLIKGAIANALLCAYQNGYSDAVNDITAE